MIIREATLSDAEAMLAIYAPYVEHTAVSFEYEVPTLDDFRNRIVRTQAKYPWIVAEVDGRIAGYAYAGDFKERAAFQWSVETSIYVDGSMKRSGIGRRLHEALEQRLVAQGIQNMNACIAYIEPEDEYLTQDSVRFHERLGYQKVAHFHRSGKKFGRWYDMIWMEKLIGEDAPQPDYKDIFNRSKLLFGAETMERIAQKRVIIFGVGGVGSWCAEGLVRSGIRQLTIVDFDRVCVTNINRQLMATTKTIGRVKVEALKERLLSINPKAEITTLQKVFSEDNASEFCLDDYDYIIDAIDSLKDKASLILMACRTKAKLFSSMGAALKLDSTRIKVTEFWKVQGDPLARALRNRFKRSKEFPSHKFQCVYSDEMLENRDCDIPDESASSSPINKPKTNGSIAHITAIFGFTLAGLVLNDIEKTS